MVAFFKSGSEVTRPDGTSVGVGADVSVGAFCITVSVAGGWVAVSFADPQAELTSMKNKTINTKDVNVFLRMKISFI
jgi:hypothetical protein